jgi:hypothetical protein
MRKAARAVNTGRLFDWRGRSSFRFAFFTIFTGLPPMFRFSFSFESSSLTSGASFAVSILYRFADSARFECFASGWRRLYRQRASVEQSDPQPVRWQFKANHTE